VAIERVILNSHFAEFQTCPISVKAGVGAVKDPSALPIRLVIALFHCDHDCAARPKGNKGGMTDFAASVAAWRDLENAMVRSHSADFCVRMPICVGMFSKNRNAGGGFAGKH
jgi:hypothetical protein